ALYHSAPASRAPPPPGAAAPPPASRPPPPYSGPTSSWPTASATPSASSRRADGSRRMPETPEGRTRVRWTLVALLVLHAATRLPGLSLLPPFLDEDQAVHWSLLIAEGQKLERPWNYGKGLS